MDYLRYGSIFFLIFYQLFTANAATSEECWIRNDDDVTEYFSETKFKIRSCVLCYVLLPEAVFTQKIQYNFTVNKFEDENGLFDLPDFEDTNSTLYESFKNVKNAENWQKCCKSAHKCCDKMKKEVRKDSKMSCRVEWDVRNRFCWERQQDLGNLVENDCPNIHVAYSFEARSPCRRFMRRKCNEYGNWSQTVAVCTPMEFQRYKPDYNPDTDEVTSPSQCCRTERGVELSIPAFKLDSCARCYNYLPSALLSAKLNYLPQFGSLTGNGSRLYAEATSNNYTQIILATIPDPMKQHWRKCCDNAEKCLAFLLRNSTKTLPSGKFCPATWDGWTCFGNAPAPSVVSEKPCPDYAYNFNSRKPSCLRYATKTCFKNGTWLWNWARLTPAEYTDYTKCNRVQEVNAELKFNIAMFIISMVAIVPALVIFHCYRQLRVNRIKMHVQLFIALFFNCFFSVIFKGVVVMEQTVEGNASTMTIMEENGAGCKILVILTKYFRLSVYSWMLCEGFYLHNLIAAAFSDQKKIMPFLFLGWVFPIIPVVAFAITRATSKDHDALCWSIPNDNDWILYAPALFSLLLNFVFLCHIIYILITKLRSVQTNESSHFRKAVRATVVLIPLFGAHYILVIYKPKDGPCIYLDIANYAEFFVDGLQGFVVAIIYCYLNGEVLSLLKRTYNRYRARRGLDQRNRARLSVSTQVSGIHEVHRNSTTIQQQRLNSIAHIKLPNEGEPTTNHYNNNHANNNMNGHRHRNNNETTMVTDL